MILVGSRRNLEVSRTPSAEIAARGCWALLGLILVLLRGTLRLGAWALVLAFALTGALLLLVEQRLR